MRLIKIFILLVIANCANAQNSNTTKPNNAIDSIKWLVGSWQMSIKNKGKIIESWRYQDDSTLKSASYFIKLNGDSILQETVELVYRQGNLFYIPTVTNQNNNKPISFKLTSFANNTLVFENPEHDFPQKITYQLQSKNNLMASIEGFSKGVYKKEKFYMIKQKK